MLDIRLRFHEHCSKMMRRSLEESVYMIILFTGIQQENRHIRQLQHENKELRASLEEHQNVLELIMKKYRQHMSCLIHSTKIEKDMLKQDKSKVSMVLSVILDSSSNYVWLPWKSSFKEGLNQYFAQTSEKLL